MGERIRTAGAIAWALVGLAVLVVLFGIVAWWVRVIFPPLIFAGAIVFILNPLVRWLHKHGVPRAAGTGLTYLAIGGTIMLMLVVSAPIVRDQADDFSNRWPVVREKVETWVNDLAERSKADDWVIKIPDIDEIEDQLSGSDPETGEKGTDLGEAFTRAREIGTQVFEIALILLLGPIIAFYLLVDLPHLRRLTDSLIPLDAQRDMHLMGHRLNHAIGGFFRGQLVVALIVGSMVSIGLFLIDLPFWLVVGMIAGLFNIIPLIGPWIGAVPGIIIALATRDVGTAVWVGVVMAGAQQIDNHFISPLVMQRAVKVHPAAVMMALLAGGTLGGFFGLLIAVPVIAFLKIVTGHLWHRFVLGHSVEQLAGLWNIDRSHLDVAPSVKVPDLSVDVDDLASAVAVVDAESGSADPESTTESDQD